MAKRRSSTEEGKDTIGVGTKAKLANKSDESQSHAALREAAPSFSTVEFYARVARRAYDLFERRGREEGHDVEDWLEAERLVKDEMLQDSEAITS
jgi:hypothetical protein